MSKESIESAIGSPLSGTAEYDCTDVIKAYFQGQRDAAHSWAWWQDGVQMVGCGIHTLSEANSMIDLDERLLIDTLP